jgi:hypothetical protein
MVMALTAVFALAGCGDFSQRTIGGVRRTDDLADAPKPAPALRIANPPAAAAATNPVDPMVQQAAFVPDRPTPNPAITQDPMRLLYVRAAERIAKMDSYIYRMRRREVVNGQKMPEEVLRVELRREPFSVRLKWLGQEGKGREAVYVKGRYGDKMQLSLAAGDAFFLSPAGMRWSIAPDDSMARAKSRYPITETGLGSLIDRFGQIVKSIEQGDTRVGAMKYLGPVKREEFEAQVDAVHQVVPAKSDPNLPSGGQRWWYFDRTSGLPVLIVTKDASDQVVEYYCHDHIQWPVQLDDADFNPDRLWRK